MINNQTLVFVNDMRDTFQSDFERKELGGIVKDVVVKAVPDASKTLSDDAVTATLNAAIGQVTDAAFKGIPENDGSYLGTIKSTVRQYAALEADYRFEKIMNRIEQSKLDLSNESHYDMVVKYFKEPGFMCKSYEDDYKLRIKSLRSHEEEDIVQDIITDVGSNIVQAETKNVVINETVNVITEEKEKVRKELEEDSKDDTEDENGDEPSADNPPPEGEPEDKGTSDDAGTTGDEGGDDAGEDSSEEGLHRVMQWLGLEDDVPETEQNPLDIPATDPEPFKVIDDGGSDKDEIAEADALDEELGVQGTSDMQDEVATLAASGEESDETEPDENEEAATESITSLHQIRKSVLSRLLRSVARGQESSERFTSMELFGFGKKKKDDKKKKEDESDDLGATEAEEDALRTIFLHHKYGEEAIGKVLYPISPTALDERRVPSVRNLRNIFVKCPTLFTSLESHINGRMNLIRNIVSRENDEDANKKVDELEKTSEEALNAAKMLSNVMSRAGFTPYGLVDRKNDADLYVGRALLRHLKGRIVGEIPQKIQSVEDGITGAFGLFTARKIWNKTPTNRMKNAVKSLETLVWEGTSVVPEEDRKRIEAVLRLADVQFDGRVMVDGALQEDVKIAVDERQVITDQAHDPDEAIFERAKSRLEAQLVRDLTAEEIETIKSVVSATDPVGFVPSVFEKFVLRIGREEMSHENLSITDMIRVKNKATALTTLYIGAEKLGMLRGDTKKILDDYLAVR